MVYASSIVATMTGTGDSDFTVVTATALRTPGTRCAPIAHGAAPAALITNRKNKKFVPRDGKEEPNPLHTPGYVISRREWHELQDQNPDSRPDPSRVQAFQVGGDFRNGLSPLVLSPAAQYGVHTVVVSLGSDASSRKQQHGGELDLLDLDYENDREVAWSAVIVPCDWYESLTGTDYRARLYASYREVAASA